MKKVIGLLYTYSAVLIFLFAFVMIIAGNMNIGLSLKITGTFFTLVAVVDLFLNNKMKQLGSILLLFSVLLLYAAIYIHKNHCLLAFCSIVLAIAALLFTRTVRDRREFSVTATSYMVLAFLYIMEFRCF